MARDDGLQDEYRDAVVRLADLTVNSPRIERVTFVNCRIIGPAVILPMNGTEIRHSNWEAPGYEAIAWPFDDDRESLVGVIVLDECTVSRCRMSDIGLAMPRSRYEELESGFTQ